MTNGSTIHVFNVYKDGKAGLAEHKGVKGSKSYEIVAIHKNCNASFSDLKDKEVSGYFCSNTGIVVTEIH